MQLRVNDESYELQGTGCTLHHLLLAIGREQSLGIAVAVNNDVVPKEHWQAFTLNENDDVFIVQATQGG